MNRDDYETDDVSALKRLSEKFGVPAIDLNQICLLLDDLELVPREIAERHVMAPVLQKDDRLFVAMANPEDRTVIDELEFVTGKKVYPYVAVRGTLVQMIDLAYSLREQGKAYYVGPRCPPEVLRKVGLDPAMSLPPRGPDHGSRMSSPPRVDPSIRAEPIPRNEPGLVVEDAMDLASESSPLPESDFSDLSDELSAVSAIPGGMPGTGRTIFVVEDEDDIRAMVKRLLEGKGYNVIESANGREALRMVKEHSPDLIVLDAMLPEVHGFDIARRIKGSKRYGHIPIIMVSAVYRGWRYAEDLRESCGVEHYIEKPFKIKELLEAVVSCLETETPGSQRDRDIDKEAERALRAGVQAYQDNRLDEAVTHLKRGIELDPLAYRLHFHLGLLYGKKDKVYDAIAALERAVEINSRHFPALKNLAILYQKAGFRNKATEMWERALNHAGDDTTKKSIREHLLTLF